MMPGVHHPSGNVHSSVTECVGNVVHIRNSVSIAVFASFREVREEVRIPGKVLVASDL